MIHSANLGLRFFLELCALAALGYWGWRTGSTTLAKVGLAASGVIATAVVWGTFVAPNANVSVPGPLHVLLQVLVFGAAAGALYTLHRPTMASVFAITVIANAGLMAAWDQ